MVAFDNVGPSSAGQGTTTSPLAWSHTVNTGPAWLLVAFNVDGPNVSYVAPTVTCDSVAMTEVGHVQPSGVTGTYLAVWYTSGLASGSHSISCAYTAGGLVDMEGGSLSFTGVQGLGSPVTAQGVSATVTDTAGNIVAGFCGCGNDITATPGTSRFLNNFEHGNGGFLGNISGVTQTATGSDTLTWTTSASSNSQAALLVEVQGAAIGPALPPQEMGQRMVTVVSNAGWRGAQHSR